MLQNINIKLFETLSQGADKGTIFLIADIIMRKITKVQKRFSSIAHIIHLAKQA